MPTTTPDANSSHDLQTLAESLYRGITRNRYDLARQISGQIAAMHSIRNHRAIIDIFDRARDLIRIQKAMAAGLSTDLSRAAAYQAARETSRMRAIAG